MRTWALPIAKNSKKRGESKRRKKRYTRKKIGEEKCRRDPS